MGNAVAPSSLPANAAATQPLPPAAGHPCSAISAPPGAAVSAATSDGGPPARPQQIAAAASNVSGLGPPLEAPGGQGGNGGPTVDPLDPGVVALEATMALTRQIRVASTWRDLRELLATHGSVLDAIHLTTAARRLRLLAPKPGKRMGNERASFREFVAGFTELCGHHLPSMPPSALAAVIYALASLRCPPPEPWMAAWLAASSGQLEAFGPRELSNSMTALGQLGFHPSDAWLTRLCAVALRHMEATGPAAEAAGAEDTSLPPPQPEPRPSLRRAAASKDPGALPQGAPDAPGGRWEDDDRASAGTAPPSASQPSAPSPHVPFTPYGLCSILWGMAKLGYLPSETFMASISSETLSQLPAFRSMELSNTLWAMTTLSYRPADPWVAEAARACLRAMPSACAFDLSIWLWALVHLGFRPDQQWLAGFLAASHSRLPSAQPEHSARILWSLAKVGVIPPEGWMRRWLGLTYVQLLEVDTTTIATIAFSLASLGVVPGRKWMDTLLVAAFERSLAAFSPGDLVILLHALAKLSWLPDAGWMDEHWAVSYRRLKVLPARKLALLLWSYVKLGQGPSQQWLSAFELASLARMDRFTPEGLSLLVYSYGRLEQAPSREWLLALYGACAARRFEGFTALALERVLWGIARIAPPPDASPAAVPGWVPAFLECSAEQLRRDPGLSFCSLANLCYALAVLGVRPGRAWLEVAVERALALVGEALSIRATKMSWALPRLMADLDGGCGGLSAGAGADGGSGGVGAGAGADGGSGGADVAGGSVGLSGGGDGSGQGRPGTGGAAAGGGNGQARRRLSGDGCGGELEEQVERLQGVLQSIMAWELQPPPGRVAAVRQRPGASGRAGRVPVLRRRGVVS